MDDYRNVKSSWGLEKDPFSSSPDPGFFYPTGDHKAALYRLLTALRLKRGLSLILGDVGTGKTTLCRRLYHVLSGEPHYEVHVLPNTVFHSETEFLAKLAQLFHLDLPPDHLKDHPKTDLPTGRYLDEIEKNLLHRNVEDGKTVVLLIDEAQKLDRASLEILRTLLNYETNEHKLLQLILLSQLEILPKIVGLKNFWDRIALKFILHPMSRPEMKEMIAFRLRAAGYRSERPLFPDATLRRIHRHTKGHPRRVTGLCHRLLEMLAADGKEAVDRRMVKAAIAGESGFLPARPPSRLPRLLMGTALVSFLVLLVNAAGFLAAGSLYDGALAVLKRERLAEAADEAAYKAERRNLIFKVALLEETLGETERLAGKLAALVGMERMSLQKGVGPIPEPKSSRSPNSIDALDRAISLQAKIRELTKIQEDKLLYIASTPSLWPVRGWVTSDFGYRRSPFSLAPDFHEGIDIAAARGTPITAPADGVVTFAGYKGGYGKLVIIDHGFGITTKFGHTAELFVQEGQKIERGAKIASVGNTGHSTGSHLHYEILADGVPVNPMRYIVEEEDF